MQSEFAMVTGLFDSPPQPVARPLVDEPPPEAYRAVCGAAIAAVTVAALSPLAFIDWWLAAVPALGLVLAVLALRDISRRPLELTGRPLALVALAISALSLGGGLTWRSIVYAQELPAGFERLHYAMLQPTEGDPPGTVPAEALAFTGRDVLLKGYMYPGKQQSRIVQFLLVRDQGDCCFGGNPKITDRVLVNLAGEEGISFTPRLVKIAGRFRVEPVGFAAGADGGVLYHIDGAQVR
jgi:hypothetical protein